MQTGSANLMTVAEVAAMLGYTPQHVRLLLRQGKLFGTKVGRDWLLPSSAVHEFAGRRATRAFPFTESTASD